MGLSVGELAQVFSNLAMATAGSPMTQQRAMGANQGSQSVLRKEYEEELEEENKFDLGDTLLRSFGGTVGGIAAGDDPLQSFVNNAAMVGSVYTGMPIPAPDLGRGPEQPQAQATATPGLGAQLGTQYNAQQPQSQQGLQSSAQGQVPGQPDMMPKGSPPGTNAVPAGQAPVQKAAQPQGQAQGQAQAQGGIGQVLGQAALQGLGDSISPAVMDIIGQFAQSRREPRYYQTGQGGTDLGDGRTMMPDGTINNTSNMPPGSIGVGPGAHPSTLNVARQSEEFNLKDSILSAIAESAGAYGSQPQSQSIPSAPMGLDPMVAQAMAAPYREDKIRAEEAAREMDLFNREMDLKQQGVDLQKEGLEVDRTGQNVAAAQRGVGLQQNEQAMADARYDAEADRMLQAAGFLQDSQNAQRGYDLDKERVGISQAGLDLDRTRTQSDVSLKREQQASIQGSNLDSAQAIGRIKAYRDEGVAFKDVPADVIMASNNSQYMQLWVASQPQERREDAMMQLLGLGGGGGGGGGTVQVSEDLLRQVTNQ